MSVHKQSFCGTGNKTLWDLPVSYCHHVISSIVFMRQFMTVNKFFISVINQLVAQNLFHNKFISCLYMFRAHVLIIRWSKLHHTYRWPSHAQVERGLVHETATYRCDDTRGCVMQFWPPDDEHMCSKHVEAWNKKNLLWNNLCASSWLNTEMRGQQKG